MDDLTIKALVVLAMMIFVGWLTIRARRQNFDAFRSKHSRRKYRVPAEPTEPKS